MCIGREDVKKIHSLKHEALTRANSSSGEEDAHFAECCSGVPPCLDELFSAFQDDNFSLFLLCRSAGVLVEV